MNKDLAISNILYFYDLALEFEIEEGLAWYAEARRICARWADELHLAEDVFVQVVAALSPRTFWDRNIKQAVDFVCLFTLGYTVEEIQPKLGTLGMNVRRAWAIMTGNTDALQGPKIQAFYQNIIDQSLDAVTVDTWAYRVCLGDLNAKAVGFSEAYYRVMEEAYQEAARIKGLRPFEIQAVTWIVIRRRARFARDFQAQQLYFFGEVA